VRLAFVSPLPPLPTGIADYAADVLAALDPVHEVEAFCDQRDVDAGRLPRAVRVRPVGELPARHRERRFDVVVHQMGNGRAHDFVYGVLSRVPGLLVLHDLVLHHARAAHFLESDAVRAWRASPASPAAREAARPALEAWRAELEYCYPGRGEHLFAAHLGTVGDLLPYAYPLFRIPVEASRAVAVHNRFMAEAVRAEVPGTPVALVPMPAAAAPVSPEAVAALRRRLGLRRDDVVVGVFGLLTPEKRVDTVARAVARASAREPRLRLLLAGPVPDRPTLDAALARHGLRERAAVTGRVPLEDLPAHVEAADVVAHLRYPTARETSAALHRVLAQGRAAIVSDLEHQAELPDDAVVRVDPSEEEDGLVAALLRLAADPSERARLGAAAAAHARSTCGPGAVRDAWEEALALARGLPDPAPRAWPGHWPRPDGSG
jgi:glycosyltransferase involved in cell wall biosynthesis